MDIGGVGVVDAGKEKCNRRLQRNIDGFLVANGALKVEKYCMWNGSR